MIKKIDIQSDEFQIQFELTKQFTDKVCEEHGFVYNPELDVNESIQMGGLTRNKLIYDKRFCPCFMVVGNTDEQRASSENRLCPCTPALTNEIPTKGHCHCAIFCTPEYAKSIEEQNIIEEDTVHSKGLSKQECEEILKKISDKFT